MIKIRNEKQKNKYFDEQIEGDGAYFNVKYSSNETKFIWVKRFENWNKDGSDWYLEYPNHLLKYNFKSADVDIPDYLYKVENVAYEINSSQIGPFLPDEFEIEFITDDDIDAIKYMLSFI